MNSLIYITIRASIRTSLVAVFSYFGCGLSTLGVWGYTGKDKSLNFIQFVEHLKSKIPRI